jgi:hypothetical protein
MDTLKIALSVFDAYRAEKLAKERGLSLDSLVSLLLSKEVIITSPNPAPNA